MRVMLAWMVALAAVLAGCTDAEDGPDAATDERDAGDLDGTQANALPADGEMLVFTDCLQFHTSYAGRAEDFQSQVPEGYTLVQDDQGLVDLYVTPSACTLNGTVSEQMWISVPVIPPGGLADPEAFHRLALEAYADDALANEFGRWGIDMVVPCTCLAERGIPQALGFQVQSEAGDYDMQTALTPSSGPFDVPPTWMYIPEDGEVNMRLYFGSGASQNLGIGGVFLVYQGQGGAPPAFPGYLAHVVDGLAFNLTIEEVA